LNATLCREPRTEVRILNATLCRDPKTDLKICDLPVMTEDSYATMPLGIVLPRQLPVDEDVLYTSFEAALSDRLTALNDHWNSQGDGQLTSIQQTPVYTMELLQTPAYTMELLQTPAYATDLFQAPSYATDLLETPPYATDLSQTSVYAKNQLLVKPSCANTEPLTIQSDKIVHLWSRPIIFVCLALMLLMVGFDLMGLLVLLIR
jgi:hypothetical protein